MALLETGTKAPNFSLLNEKGELISLNDFLGKKIILYFYPKDNTPGCTTQACGFRDSYSDIKAANTIVIGISKDSIKSHNNFITKYELPFLLLSDKDNDVCEKYGVWQLKKNYGKEYMGIVRTTYLINEEGIIEKVFPKVKVEGHIEEVLSYIK